MPDNDDYEVLGRLLAHPETWSDRKAEYLLRLWEGQAPGLADCHPKDRQRIASLTTLQDQIEAAIARWSGAR